MKIFIFVLLATIVTTAQAQSLIIKPACDLELYSVGKGESTPLQQEVEWMLKVKGYNITHPKKFDLSAMPAYQMFASYRAGDASITGNADCLIEEFQGFGKRYSCSYELSLVTMDIMGNPVLFNSIQYAVRMSADSEEFYRNIREQLRVLPSCGF